MTHLTPTGDTYLPPCVGHSGVYDTLIEASFRSRTTYDEIEAIRDAQTLCATCPIQTECWADNWDERWLKMLTGRAVDNANEARRATMLEHVRLWHERRLAAVRSLIDTGADLAGVLDHLGVTRTALRLWCRKNGHHAEWEYLTGQVAK